MVQVRLTGRRGIAPTRNCTDHLKNILKLFECKKPIFLNFPFFILFIPLADIIGIKPAPGDHESNFKKMVQYQGNRKKKSAQNLQDYTSE